MLTPNPVRFDEVCVIIPALNEENSIGLVLGDLPSVGCVIVVDNGSHDRTAAIAGRLGAAVVRESRRGYGTACLRGLAELSRLARERAWEPKVIVFLDADYSDHPELLPSLVHPVLSGEADFVLGSRLAGRRAPGAMPIQSVLGNQLACALMKLIFRAQFTDLGPFRAVRYDRLQQMKMSDPNFGWTIEMQIKATRHRLRIQETPVPYRCRIGTSKISGTVAGSIKAGYKILFTIGKYSLQPPPKR